MNPPRRFVPGLLMAMLAGCTRIDLPPSKPRPAPAATRPPTGPPAWVARRVVPDAIETPAGRVHTVKAGETGIAIARAYGVKWSSVAAANGLDQPYVLEVGQRLTLPARRAVAAMTVEQRAAAFRLDIDDLITGAEPAARPAAGRVAGPVAVATPRPAALAGPVPRFAWPVEGRVVSRFGAKPGGRFNDGVNIAAAADAPVRAAADGVVAYAGSAVAGFGELLLIRHAGGWVTAYAHNAALLVARGATVRRGQAVARVGATGAVDTPQLHFEVRQGRRPIDPLKALPPPERAG